MSEVATAREIQPHDPLVGYQQGSVHRQVGGAAIQVHTKTKSPDWDRVSVPQPGL
jgi:hypothetical protein